MRGNINFPGEFAEGHCQGVAGQGDEIVLQLIGLRVGVEYSAEGEIPLANVWGYGFSPCL